MESHDHGEVVQVWGVTSIANYPKKELPTHFRAVEATMQNYRSQELVSQPL